MSLVGSKGSNANSLTTVFEGMAYNGTSTEDLSSIMKWLESRKQSLSSCVAQKPYESAGSSSSVTISGKSIKVITLEKEDDVVAASKSAVGSIKQGAGNVDSAEKQKRLQVLKKALTTAIPELVQLEAYAGQIPTELVKKHDAKLWEASLSSRHADYFQSRLEVAGTHVLFEPMSQSYDMKNILPVISAIVQNGKPLLVFIAVKGTTDLRFILPIFRVLDCVKTLADGPRLDVVLFNSAVLNSGLLQKLAPLGIKKLLIPSVSSCRALGLQKDTGSVNIISSAALSLSDVTGKSVHFIVEGDGDAVTAAGSLSRNVWMSGLEMNHRCRVLVFIHQALYAPVVDKLKESVLKLNVKETGTEVPSGCDFVTKRVELTDALRRVSELGGKVVSAKDDFSAPTLVYDIGTSSDLVATKTPGLGHVLVAIPFRSAAELIPLINNYGEPDKVFLYTSSITATVFYLGKLEGREIIVDGQVSPVRSLLETSWAELSTDKSTATSSDIKADSIKLPSGVSIKGWTDLLLSEKYERLENFAGGADNMKKAWSTHLNHFVPASQLSSYKIPKSDRIAGLIVVDPANMSERLLGMAIVSCILREQPVLVVSMKGGVCAGVVERAIKHLPLGLVTFVTVQSIASNVPMVSNWDLAWVFQGAADALPLDWIKRNSRSTALLVNDANDTNLNFHSEVAISTAYKHGHV